MNMEFLPQHIARALNNIDTDKLYELRLRRDFPIVLNYGGKNVFLTPAGAFPPMMRSLPMREKSRKSFMPPPNIPSMQTMKKYAAAI